MITVPSREAKNRLGRYLQLARSGETIQITDRGTPVACLVPASAPEQKARRQVLAELVAKGGIRLGSGKISPRRKAVVLKPGKSIAEMIAEDRR